MNSETSGVATHQENQQIARYILMIRGQKVLLDAGLARLYGATTKVFNQAVKRNRDRFPPDFMSEHS